MKALEALIKFVVSWKIPRDFIERVFRANPNMSPGFRWMMRMSNVNSAWGKPNQTTLPINIYKNMWPAARTEMSMDIRAGWMSEWKESLYLLLLQSFVFWSLHKCRTSMRGIYDTSNSGNDATHGLVIEANNESYRTGRNLLLFSQSFLYLSFNSWQHT